MYNNSSLIKLYKKPNPHNNKYDIYMHHCTNAATSHVLNIPVSEIRYSTNTSDQSRVKPTNYFNKSAIIKHNFRRLSPSSIKFYKTNKYMYFYINVLLMGNEYC